MTGRFRNILDTDFSDRAQTEEFLASLNQETRRALRAALLCSDFTPTHQHAEGGLYQMLSEVKFHSRQDTWIPAVLYRNAKGQQFVRTKEAFESRFTPLDTPRNTPDDAALMRMVRVYHGWHTDAEMIEAVGYSLELYVAKMREALASLRS